MPTSTKVSGMGVICLDGIRSSGVAGGLPFERTKSLGETIKVVPEMWFHEMNHSVVL